MIDPFDEVENKETPVEIRAKANKETPMDIRAKALYEIFLYLFKFLLGALFIIIIILILKPEKGIVVESFEIAGMNESSVFVANHLCFELLTIKEIYSKSIENKEKNKSINKEAPILPLFDLPGNSLDYSMTSLGNVGMGGTSLSLGHLILTLKQSINFSSPKLSGSIQGSGSDLRIVAILNKPTMAWEIKKNISDEGCTFQENIPTMVEDLAYQIANSLINENEKTNKGQFPKTWEALKYLTLSRKAYLRYDATRNISCLNESKDFALNAKIAEPRYKNISIMLNNIGASYLEEHYIKEAVGLFSNATMANPSSIKAWEGLGVAYLLEHNYSDSIEAYKNIPVKSADTWYNMGLAYYYSKNFAASIEAFNESTNITPENGDAWYNKGLSLKSLGRNDEAIEAYNKALILDKKNADAWYNKGISLRSLDRNDEAIAAYDAALRLNNSFLEAWINKGNALQYKGKNIEAIEAYNKALILDKKNADAWYNKGISLGSLGRNDEAIAAYDEALESDRKNADAWFNKGIILMYLKDYDKAIRAYTEVLILTNFTDKYAWHYKGNTLYEKGNVSNDSKFYYEAIEAFDEALKLDPQYAPAWESKGDTLNELRDYNGSYLAFKQASELYPLSPDQDRATDKKNKAMSNLR